MEPEGVEVRKQQRGNEPIGANGGGGYQRLAAWQKGMDLVEAVYHASRNWPREFAHHVSIAYGSLSELETQILIAQRLGYSDAESVAPVTANIVEVRRITRGLLNSLRQQSPEPAQS